MNSTYARLKLCAGEFKLNLQLNGMAWSKAQTIDQSERVASHGSKGPPEQETDVSVRDLLCVSVI